MKTAKGANGVVAARVKRYGKKRETYSEADRLVKALFVTSGVQAGHIVVHLCACSNLR